MWKRVVRMTTIVVDRSTRRCSRGASLRDFTQPVTRGNATPHRSSASLLCPSSSCFAPLVILPPIIQHLIRETGRCDTYIQMPTCVVGPLPFRSDDAPSRGDDFADDDDDRGRTKMYEKPAIVAVIRERARALRSEREQVETEEGIRVARGRENARASSRRAQMVGGPNRWNALGGDSTADLAMRQGRA
ncbi:hypothetical protein ALC62_03763 [Cyphomyrmex costatus]|uniref:Uncharacterized protein n=1 Tax=Cyphomyrmex costatus TaxID=456900 RepID=A0A151IL09_9HYME|nr:hypothetical protein ALC62_03763 [Cyphomyrmex costatus]